VIYSLQETDAGLLSIISYPAFAVDDPELIDKTRDTLLEKLKVREVLYSWKVNCMSL
jgi:phosphorylase kinase alpha/beta subunit